MSLYRVDIGSGKDWLIEADKFEVGYRGLYLYAGKDLIACANPWKSIRIEEPDGREMADWQTRLNRWPLYQEAAAQKPARQAKKVVIATIDSIRIITKENAADETFAECNICGTGERVSVQLPNGTWMGGRGCRVKITVEVL